MNNPKKPKFACVGVLGRAGKHSVAETLIQIVQVLQKLGVQVVVGVETAKIITLPSQAYFDIAPADTLAKRCDLIVVVGGDGSILQASRLVAETDTPILGVNRGRLGFLADVHPDELEQHLTSVMFGQYHLDKRFLLSMQIFENGRMIAEDVALNDVVLHAGKSVHTIDYQLAIDGQAVYRHHADGLIVSTPTGSTAYSLSAGGPIIHPSLDAICLVPMYPHTLSSRPIVVAGSSRIEIIVHKDNRTQPMVSADGKTSVPLYPHQTLCIAKFHSPVTLIHPSNFDFYGACRTKLNWSLYPEEFSLNKE